MFSVHLKLSFVSEVGWGCIFISCHPDKELSNHHVQNFLFLLHWSAGPAQPCNRFPNMSRSIWCWTPHLVSLLNCLMTPVLKSQCLNCYHFSTMSWYPVPNQEPLLRGEFLTDLGTLSFLATIETHYLDVPLKMEPATQVQVADSLQLEVTSELASGPGPHGQAPASAQWSLR